MRRAREATPVDRKSSVTLSQQVHDDLVRRMRAGDFADGFPADSTLMREYEVSRYTVREALRRLRAGGLSRGERGRTPRLTPPAEIDQPVGVLYSLFASVESAGQEQRSIVRSLDIRADSVVAGRLGLEESTPLVYLERLRLASDRPLALDRVWLPAATAAPLLRVDFTQTALYNQLHARCGVRVTGGEEHIRAVLPTRAERLALELPDGVAAFAIERLGHAGTAPIEWRHTLVRGDRFAMRAHFSGHAGYQLVGGTVTPS